MPEPQSFRTLLEPYRAELPVLSEVQLEQLQKHFDLLLRWNKVLNLSSVREPGEVVERHFCESLFLAGYIPEGRWSIADLGSGGGFPGIPVAVARPDCEVTLIESHGRKSVFLKEACRDLKNVAVANQRVESVDHDFNWVTSRAVSLDPLAWWIEKHADAIAVLASRPNLNGFEWRDSVPIPWGESRFLEIARNVSRETFVG
jgi:16S rRNA (guanine(527)-N(7))-methyltransferase RsmG